MANDRKRWTPARPVKPAKSATPNRADPPPADSPKAERPPGAAPSWSQPPLRPAKAWTPPAWLAALPVDRLALGGLVAVILVLAVGVTAANLGRAAPVVVPPDADPIVARVALPADDTRTYTQVCLANGLSASVCAISQRCAEHGGGAPANPGGQARTLQLYLRPPAGGCG